MTRSTKPSVEQVRQWKIPAPPGPEPETPPPPPREFMHGYTLDDIARMARYVVTTDRWHSATDWQDRYDAIWHGIVEHILTASDPPTKSGLFGAARAASDRHIYEIMQTHGRNRSGLDETLAGFERYWTTAPTASPEQRVVDRVALRQIWPTLTPADRQALSALAYFENYDQAASACGIKLHAFESRIHKARKRFLALWHQHETPSSPWRSSRQTFSRSGLDSKGRKRLTGSQLDALRQRKHDGEKVPALAAEAGVSAATLYALLSGKQRPALDRENGETAC